MRRAFSSSDTSFSSAKFSGPLTSSKPVPFSGQFYEARKVYPATPTVSNGHSFQLNDVIDGFITAQ